MKKTFFLLVFGILSCSYAFAAKIDGYFITNKHDTVNVTFKIPVGFISQIPNYQSIQYKIKYYDKASGKKITLRPEDALEIGFRYGNVAIKMLSRSYSFSNNPFSNDGKIFLRLQIDGPLKMFRYYYTQSSPGHFNGATGAMTGGYSYNVEQYVLQRGDEPLKWPRTWSFRKDMKEYFSDCPALVEMIDSKEFRKNEVEAIVEFYNSKCL
jgi:hypothetical protein